MRALVTGATGFIGNHVASTLRDRGYDVRALVRPGAGRDRRMPLPEGVERVPGHLLDRDALSRAAAGCQAVFHVAALYDLWSARPADFYAANVGGTQAVLDTATAAKVERIVYTSSVATIAPAGQPIVPSEPATAPEGTERSFASLRSVHSHYKRSKILAERVALKRAAEGWPVVVVNPSTPIGSGDVKPTPTGKIVLDFLRGRMPAYVDTGLNLIDVEDVAAGHVLALERGRDGERYILGNSNVTLREMLEALAAITGRKAPRLRLPLAVAFAAGGVSELIEGRLLRRRPSIPFEGVWMASRPMFYDPSKARRELGLPQTPIAEALFKSTEWFRCHGYC